MSQTHESELAIFRLKRQISVSPEEENESSYSVHPGFTFTPDFFFSFRFFKVMNNPWHLLCDIKMFLE